MAEPRFLVVRLGSLGDIVHTFPAVAALRESFPRAEIIWITHPRWESLVERSGLTSMIRTIETRSWDSLRKALPFIRARGWDAAIDYQGLWKSASIPFLGGVNRRIGFSWENIREYGVPVLYTERVRTTSKHIAEQNGELSLRAGANRSVAPVTLRVTDEDAADVSGILAKQGIGDYVLLSPGGGWRSKCWPPERFGALCERIGNELKLRCVVNYAPGEENLAKEIVQNAGKAAPFCVTGNLGQLMALLKKSKCLVAGDTGPLHLGVALGTPAVALFGPTDPVRNGPYRSNDIVLRSAGAVTSYKRGEQPDVSMLQLSVEDVSRAVSERVVRKK